MAFSFIEETKLLAVLFFFMGGILFSCTSREPSISDGDGAQATKTPTIVQLSVMTTDHGSGTPPPHITRISTQFSETPTNFPTHLGVSTQISSIDGMMMVYVPAGPFLMGSSDEEVDYAIENCIPEEHPEYECPRSWFKDEQPQHEVYLDAYWIDQTEVTNDMFERFLNETGATAEVIVGKAVGKIYFIDTLFSQVDHKDGIWYTAQTYDEHPVAGVTWNGASTYCEWAGKHLPTEAQWEKAARGTEGWIFPWGDEGIDCNRANYGGCVGDTTPVGDYPEGASPYGAQDMIGNVWEWVQDWFEEDYYSQSPYVNPVGPIISEEPIMGWPHVLRGGWALGDPRDTYTHRTTARWLNAPGYGSEVIGFRCVSSP